jgi:hypothetical protein
MTRVCKYCEAKEGEVNFPKAGFVCRKCANKKMSDSFTNIKVRRELLEDAKKAIGLITQAHKAGVSVETIKHAWLKNEDASLFVTNPLFNTGDNIADIDFKSLFGSIDPIIIKKAPKSEKKGLFDRLVFTDVHVGMDVSDTGYSLYDLKWDKEELFKRLDIMVNHTIEHQKSNTLIINDLGDFLDGYNNLTTRGGHRLPQNMSTNDAFEVAVEFKIKLIKSLAPYFDKIKMINICNDNHSGHFGYITNSAFKMYIETALKGVEIINQRRFIDHYEIENRLIVLTHGKDTHNMKFGFKPKADHGTINKVLGYLNEMQLLNKGFFEIEFGKGDSHLAIFDDSTSDMFGYYTYPAFSPSSNWVQLNFQKGRSGFIHYNYKENCKNINPYFF